MSADPFSPSADRLAPELDDAQQLVVLARALHRRGYDDHLAGHITIRQPDDTLLCNPWYLNWDEFGVDDVIRIDLAGKVLDGRWPVPPGIPLHLALHTARTDVITAVHNHPRWSTTWADRRLRPPIYDQTGALTGVEVAVVDEYDGGVNDLDLASSAVSAMGSAHIGLLAGHGVFVLARTIPELFIRCAAFEWRCRRALEVEAEGRTGHPIRPDVAAGVGNAVDTNGFPGYWEAAVRLELRTDARLLVRSATGPQTAAATSGVSP
ncbi:MAG: class II aldolase/adducin family protein [Ilumatobacteraceae bacterium]|jgi:L-fuculose-phosphate aldolase